VKKRRVPSLSESVIIVILLAATVYFAIEMFMRR
jgi:hypothetical protein